MNNIKTSSNIHPVDIYVGQQIRKKRVEKMIGQRDLAKELGITFQQVQKYERGTNRVSSSKLYEIAQVMACSLEYFFAGYEEWHNTNSSDARVKQIERNIEDNDDYIKELHFLNNFRR